MRFSGSRKLVSCILLLIFLLSIVTFILAFTLPHDRALATIPTFEVSETELYVIDGDGLSKDLYAMIVSLQGIVAQKEAKIYIKNPDNFVYAEKFVAEKGLTVTEFSDPWELVLACKEHLADNGYVLFEGVGSFTVNTAATISGVEKWLSVPRSAQEEAERRGLALKADMTLKNRDGSYVNTYESLYERYEDVLNKNVLIHQSPDLATLRDYGIAAAAFCFYTDESSKSSVDFREKVCSRTALNAPVLGWSTDEIGYVAQTTRNGLCVIASDHSSNLSYLSGCDSGEPIRQKYVAEKLVADGTKHYVALVMSDGDNLQWCQNLPFTHHYKDRQNSIADYKLTWTAPPVMATLAPEALKYLYGNANANDSFICGVSGMGYINPTMFPRSRLSSFAEMTAEAMGRADLFTLAVLDNTTSLYRLGMAMRKYADTDGIPGGFMQIGDRYQELGGRMIWCGDKPFISVRKSLWYTPDDGQSKEAFIKRIADEINAMPADPTSENGYSYINIHPWSMTIADVDLFVSLLDEHIEIVSAEEMLHLVKANVRH